MQGMKTLTRDDVPDMFDPALVELSWKSVPMRSPRLGQRAIESRGRSSFERSCRTAVSDRSARKAAGCRAAIEKVIKSDRGVNGRR